MTDTSSQAEFDPLLSAAPSSLRDRPSLRDEVASHLRDLILSGRLQAGAKLDQEAIAATMGVSRLPVREATIALASEGLIDHFPRRGAFVAHLTPDDLVDHYAIYGLVSGVAASRAARQLSAAELDELDDLRLRIDRCRNTTDLEALNFEFHRRINRSGMSRRLGIVLKTLGAGMPSHFFEFGREWHPTVAHEHAAIMEALRHADSAAAASAVAEHFRSTGESVVKALAETGYWPATSASAQRQARLPQRSPSPSDKSQTHTPEHLGALQEPDNAPQPD